MTQQVEVKDVVSELNRLRALIDIESEGLERIKALLDKHHQRHEKAIEIFNKTRREVAIKEIKKRGLTWCTKCKEVVQEKDTTVFLTMGVRRSRGGYERHSEIHRFCENCKTTALQKNDSYGKWDRDEQAQEEFHVYSVEQREDGYYRGGTKLELSEHGWKSKHLWQTIKEEDFYNPLDSMIEDVVKELGLPSKYGEPPLNR